MAKLSRYTQKIFGSNAAINQIAKFGSLAAGSPTFTTDPSVIQSLGNYLTGWFGAIVGNNSPAIEDMNAIHYLHSYQLGYLMQAGIAEYDSGTTYYTGSLVNNSGTIYCSMTDNNVGNSILNTSYWKVYTNGSRTLTASATLISTDDIIRADATNGSFTLTLPPVASTPLKRLVIKCVHTNSNTVKLIGNNSEAIDNLTQGLNVYALESILLYNTGLGWDVVDSNKHKVPTGTIQAFAGSTSPNGYLLCDGSSYSRTNYLYANLFSVIGTTWGIGDGTSTFNVPDFRGQFLRGVSNGSTANDPDRTSRYALISGTWTITGNTTNGSATISGLSSTSNFALGMTVSGSGIPANSIVGSISSSSITLVSLLTGTSSAATATATGVTLTISKSPVGDSVGSGQFDAFQGHYHAMSGNGAAEYYAGADDSLGGTFATRTSGSKSNVNSPTTDGTNGTPRNSSETRPKNAYVNYIIKL